jgi:hypothetical protein
MPRTVDTSSTLENFRVEHNNLATDIGAIGNLTTGDTSSVVNAINYIMDQYFFFQDFDYDGSDGATSNTIFSGNDNTGNTLQYSSGKVLVYKNGLLLRNGTDYTASNGTSITLASSAGNSDVVRISSYTGSYQNVNSESSSAFDAWQSAGDVIYNKNTGGIVFNADASITTTPTVGNSFQFDGPSYYNDHVHVNAVSSSPKEIRFRDADNSNYAGIKAPATISTNYTLTLPTDDGTSGQLLSTDGSGVLSWAAAGTAPDITIVANNSANETVYPVFVDGATGTQGLESDTGLSYNPSTGMLTSTGFTGALTGNASTATVLATNRNFSITGDITASAIAFNGSGNVALSATIDDNVVDASALNVSGNGSSTQALLSDGDGSFSWGSSGHTTEELQDIIGAMFSTNTETRVAATYDDTNGKINIVVDDMTADNNTTYSAGTNMSLSGTTFSSTDTNTTYSAGTNMSLSGTTFSSTDTNTVYTHPTSAGNKHVPTGGSSGQFLKYSSSGTAIWATPSYTTNTDTNTTYSAGTNMSLSGTTFSSTDTNTTYSVGAGGLTEQNFTTTLKNKLDGIAASATNTAAPHYTSAIAVGAGGLTQQNFTTTLKNKLDGIAASATATTQGYVSGNNVSFGTLAASTGTFSGAITSTGDITAYYSSDIALKENISPISQALHKVGLISGYEFDWKDHKDPQVIGKGHDVGIIAQEVEKVLPEVVMTRENGKKAVNYQKIIPLLIESIKELKSELDDLKSSNS